MSIEFSITLKNGDFSLNANSEIPSNTVVALIGHSGSGKTTLLRCLAGLERKARGTLSFENEIWQDSKSNAFIAPEARRVGYVFQRGALFSHLTVSQNLEYAVKRAAENPVLSFEKIIATTGIRPLLERNAATLSGGETQRVAIARALCSNPKLLLLDEPLSALDWEGRAELLACLEEVLATISIPTIIVTHNLADAARLATHALKMEAGSITASGSADDILPSNYELAEDRREPFTILEAKVSGHDSEYGLTELQSPVGSLTTPKRNSRTNTIVRVSIWARDISISLEKPNGTSLLNILPARVEKVEAFDESRVIVSLLCGKSKLRSLITKKSAERLLIEPNLECYCLIKAVSFIA